MKLKGELELLAEQVYGQIDKEICTILTDRAKQLRSEQAQDEMKYISTNIIDTFNEITKFIKVADVIYKAKFGVEEFKILSKLGEKEKCVRVVKESFDKLKMDILSCSEESIEQAIRIGLNFYSNIKDNE